MGGRLTSDDSDSQGEVPIYIRPLTKVGGYITLPENTPRDRWGN